MPSDYARRPGGTRRPLIRSLVAATAVGVALAGCGSRNATAPASASDDQAPVADAPAGAGAGAAHPWCDDTDWLPPAAEMYASVYRKKHRPVTASRIDDDLADGGPLWKAYRRLAGRGTLPSNLPDLREFLVSLAAADEAGADPVAYTHHIIAVCES